MRLVCPPTRPRMYASDYLVVQSVSSRLAPFMWSTVEMLRIPTRTVRVSEFLEQTVFSANATTASSLLTEAEAQDYIFANDFLRTHPSLGASLTELGHSVSKPGAASVSSSGFSPPWTSSLPDWVGFSEPAAGSAHVYGVQFYLGGACTCIDSSASKIQTQSAFKSARSHWLNAPAVCAYDCLTVCRCCYAGAGSGAQPHWHEHAWNLAVHGSKRWMIWPEARTFYAATPAATFAEQVVPKLKGANAPLQCVQQPGDLVYVPARWGHTTLNLGPTVGVAVGFRTDDAERSKLVLGVPRSAQSCGEVEPPSAHHRHVAKGEL